MPLHSHFLRKERMSRPSRPKLNNGGLSGSTGNRPKPSETVREISHLRRRPQGGNGRHQTQDVKQGRLPNGHATASPTGETIAIQRKVECRRSTTSPWAPWQRQDRVADCPQWRVSGANISDQRPSLSLGRPTKGHLREDRYRTIFSPMRPI